MPGHTKRAMAQRKANKERRACEHGQRPAASRRSKAQPGQRALQGQQRGRVPCASIYDEADPLDRQLFDYIIVVDVEATCEEGNANYPHEIIELPGVLIDVRRGVVDKQRSFRSYVRPWRNPVLSGFCKALTGIAQADVDGAPSLPEVVKAFERWYRATIPAGAKVAFAADGPWDFKNFIYEHSVLRDHVGFPGIFYEYLDIRTTFAHHFNRGAPIKLDAMLRRMQLEFEGRPHCGFDDAVNIARLAVAMMRAGCVFDFLITIPMEDAYHYPLDGYPLYRRAEGSGRLDPDVVDDIAKRCYGMEYFSFGERHREAVLQYRMKHPHQFRGMTVKQMEKRLHRGRLAIRCRLVALCALVVVAAGMLLALLFTRVSRWWGRPP
ncbi:uncharacterized protein Tco025E_03711 [Trypanosoma conorhini]|uniref:Exonuclease domain-containing protein n=1 Tax=Trypanosoma conorhini TaxID=83891 RepID=A0A422PS59_9TRYP|nr:uncharacterized protein Tco025E_03711 [Trypanosoma conorhini]RNF20584.1 hypothetical protein Tco025E_03711 [Trypanosoma conorhini]